jgi:DNA polymerase I-like protein with 3'-5' exonuclease and polymerase domains
MQICRRALVPREGHQLVEIDFSGLEVRIAACYHKDPKMLEYINDPKSDMHRDMAIQIFMLDKFDKTKHNILRQAAKNGFVFPEFYGDYFGNCAIGMAYTWCKLPQSKWDRGQGITLDGDNFTISDHLIAKGISSLDDFTDHIRVIEKDFWENRFPDYAEWKDRWWKIYQKYGYVDLLTGFRCSGVMGKNDSINYPVQGAAFHCNLWTFIELDRIMQKEKWDTRLIGQIHDSIIMDVHPAELPHVIETAKRVAGTDLRNTWPWIIVPLDIDIEYCPIDGNWSEKVKL